MKSSEKQTLFGKYALSSLAAACVMGMLATPTFAQQDETPAIDPEAVAALVQMGDRLRSLETFSIAADIASEIVLDTGERLTSVHHVSIDARDKTNLRMERTSPTRERILYFDGESASLWGPVTRYYTTVPFSGTNADLITHLANKFGYELPLSDLFLWGLNPEDEKSITQARFIRSAQIDGRLCNQYAFRMEGDDLQMWIDTAEGGLPCAYQIVDRTDEAHPTFFATVDVETIVNLDDNRFTFNPPEDAVSIPFQPLENLE